VQIISGFINSPSRISKALADEIKENVLRISFENIEVQT
jgi:hypothetical protein